MAMAEKDAQQAQVREKPNAHSPEFSELEVPQVTWWKESGLLRLYIMTPIIFLCATTSGYDGSLLNGLQTNPAWQECEESHPVAASLPANQRLADFGNPEGSLLGLFTTMMALGQLSALPISSYAADFLGRRRGVMAGILIIFLGTVIQRRFTTISPGIPRINIAQVIPGPRAEGLFLGGRFLVGLG